MSARRLQERLEQLLGELDDNKINTRKKGCSELNSLLESNSGLVDFLNHAAEAKGPATITNTYSLSWKRVYAACSKFLVKESHRLVKDASKADGRASGQIDANVAQATTLWRTIVRIANRGVARIPLGSLLPDVLLYLDVAGNDGRLAPLVREKFGSHAASLLKEILEQISVSDAHVETTGSWTTILSTVLQLFQRPPSGLAFSVTLQLLHQALVQSQRYTAIALPFFIDKFKFFSDVLSNKVVSCSGEVKALFLKILGEFMRLVYRDCRKKTCAFGEEVLTAVITMLEDRCLSDVIDFLQFQMCLHHPNGVTRVKQGAYFEDEEEWKQHLVRIYRNVIDTVITNKLRGLRRRTGPRATNFFLPQNHLDLAVRVCYQIFASAEDNMYNVTQMIPVDHTQTQSQGGAAKRRRIEISFDSLLEKVRKAGAHHILEQHEACPWTQILSLLIKRHPDIILKSRKWHDDLIKTILGLLQTSRVADVKRQLFLCAAGLMQADVDHFSDGDLMRLFELTVNTVSSNQCIEEAHLVLRHLMLSKRIKAVGNLYNRYLSRIIKRNEHSVETLLLLLTLVAPPQTTGYLNLASDKKHVSRITLLNWVLHDNEEMGDQSMDNFVKSRPDLVSQVTTALMLQSCGREFVVSCDRNIQDKYYPLHYEICVLQDQLHNTCQQALMEPASTSSGVRSRRYQVLAEVQDEVVKILVNDSGSVFRVLPRGDGLCPFPDALSATRLMAQTVRSWSKLGMQGFRNCDNFSKLHDILFKNLLPAVFNALCAALPKDLGANSDVTPIVSSVSPMNELLVEFQVNIREYLQDADRYPSKLVQSALALIDRLIEKRTDRCEKGSSGFKRQRVAVTNYDSDDEFFGTPKEIEFKPPDDFATAEKTATKDEARAWLDALRQTFLLVARMTISVDANPSAAEDRLKLICGLKKMRENTPEEELTDTLNMVFFPIATELLLQPLDDRCLFALFEAIQPKNVKKNNFNLEEASGLLRVLPLFCTKIDAFDAEARERFKNFLHSFIMMHASCNYERLSLHLQCEIVQFCRIMHLHSSASTSWASFSNELYNNACNSDRYGGLDVGDSNAGRIIVRYLLSRSQEVRSTAMSCLQGLFVYDKNTLGDRRRDIDQVLDILKHVCNSEEAVDYDTTNPEEGSNRINTLLQVFLHLAINHVSIEVEAVTAMILSQKLLNIPLDKLKKALDLIVASKSRGKDHKETRLSYISSKLGFMINEFLKYNPAQVFRGFPFELFECSSAHAFFERFETTLVALYLWYKPKLEVCKRLSQLLSRRSESVMLKRNFARIVSFYIPLVAATDTKLMTRDQIDAQIGNHFSSRAHDLHKLMYDVLTIEGFNNLLLENLAKIIAEVFMRIYDPGALQERYRLKMVLGKPNPPFTNADMTLNLIKYLEIQTENVGVLMVTLVNEFPDCLQCVVHGICSLLRQTSSSIDDKIRSLHGLDLFLEVLGKEAASLKERQFPYLLWFMVHSVLLIMSTNPDPELLRCAACVMNSILAMGFKHEVSGIGILTLAVMDVILKHLKAGNCHWEEELIKLLELIVSRSNERTVAYFTYFASDEKFAMLRGRLRSGGSFSYETPLIEAIQGFNEAVDHLAPCQMSHYMEFILFHLQERKSSLSLLLEQLEAGNGFSEDAEESLLHVLVCHLIDLCSPNHPEEVRILATRCLGEIGPCELATLCLQPQRVVCVPKGETPFRRFIPTLVKLLLECLRSPSTPVINGATKALKGLLTSRNCLDKEKDARIWTMAYPFMTDETQVDKPQFSCDKFRTECDRHDIWIVEEKSHDEWIVRLTQALLSSFSNAYCCLDEICRERVDVCEALLPFIIHDILFASWHEARPILSRHVVEFFKKFYAHNRERIFLNDDCASPAQYASYNSTKSVQVMLSVISHLREQALPDSSNEWLKNFWIQHLNYLHVATAAFHCSALFAAILYVDIWCQTLRTTEKQDDGSPLMELTSSNAGNSLIELIARNVHPVDGNQCQYLLHEAYSRLGDFDALYGCGSNNFLNSSRLVNHILKEQRYTKALQLADVHFRQAQQGTSQLVYVMNEAGMYHSVCESLSNVQEENAALTEQQFNCAWRLSQWEDYDESVLKVVPGFEQSRFFAMRSLIRKEKDEFEDYVRQARLKIGQDLNIIGKENTPCVYKALEQLRSLAELTHMGPNPMQLYTSAKASFEFKESIILQRCVMLRDYKSAPDQAKNADASFELSLSYVRECLQNNRCILGHQRIAALKEAMNTADRLNIIQLEEARLMWADDNRTVAKFLLLDLESKLNDSRRSGCREQDSLLAETRLALATLFAELKTESPHDILKNYLEPSVNLFRTLANPKGKQVTEAYMKLAKFCDSQYQQINTYTKSKEFEEKQELIRHLDDQSQKIKEMEPKTRDTKVAMITGHRNSELDRKEVEECLQERSKYLHLALENYGNALSNSECQENLVYRFVSLWLLNTEDKAVNDLVHESSKHIASAKFIDLLYQLAARLTEKETSEFPKILRSLIVRCAVGHPYHTIPVLLALANANADHSGAQSSSTKKKSSSFENMEDRSRTARRILQQLEAMNTKTSLPLLCREIKQVCHALIELAYAEGDPKKFGKQAIPTRIMNSLRVKGDLVPILTSEIKVRSDKQYDQQSVAFLSSYEGYYSFVGGINAPKKIRCLGGDGKWRNQLVKGRDDLRQDAVMQQVFGLMNNLLRSNEETRKKRLMIRRYKVVPLSDRSGVLEWCENTIPIGDYLVGPDRKSGAHARYHPEDLLAATVRAKLDEAQKKKSALVTDVFKKLCARFKPAMRYFFYERFPSPGQHFERRLAYTRSVATTSMVGYILGLGDRHVQNILIDNTTAELIHIDLGVAFEQGKILSTPETVPFRLTRDIVDGFGPSGVEGTFRRCCEATLRVLQEHKDDVLTILEVLIHDPLYNWSITPEKAYRLQHGRDPDRITKARWAQANRRSSVDGSAAYQSNKMAERVLLKVTEKLNGIEEGSHLSIEGQVNNLIQQARDPARLSKLFSGWQAYI